MYKTQNGWTKAQMIEAIQTRMLDHKSAEARGLGSTCLYRAPDGNRCAAGVFIPDDLYDPEMDRGKAIPGLLESYALLRPHMPVEERAMRNLQTIHDSCPEYCDPRPTLVEWIQNNVEDA